MCVCVWIVSIFQGEADIVLFESNSSDYYHFQQSANFYFQRTKIRKSFTPDVSKPFYNIKYLLFLRKNMKEII